MREISGDLFRLYERTAGSWIVVTTNGAVGPDGNLVMGAGVAGAAKRRLPGIERALGAHVRRHGNVPAALPGTRVLTWPTKPDRHTLPGGRDHLGWMCVTRFHDPSCLDGVRRLTHTSGLLLPGLIEQLNINGPIFAPKPGCGLGGLDWDRVGPWMHTVFDDRVVVVDPAR